MELVKAQVKGQIIAGKTGTTNDYKDAWFCGYSRYYTTSVWVGCVIQSQWII